MLKKNYWSIPYFFQAIATRDAMAKALYGTLFDWIVLQVNHALAIKQLNVVEVGLYTFSFICEVILCFSHNSVPTDCKLHFINLIHNPVPLFALING